MPRILKEKKKCGNPNCDKIVPKSWLKYCCHECYFATPKSDETLKKMSNNGKKLVFTEEHRKKISEAGKGNQYVKGRKMPPEEIESRRQALLKKYEKEREDGIIRKQKPETIEKLRIANTGRKASEETKKKRSESLKKYHQNLREQGIKITVSDETKAKLSLISAKQMENRNFKPSKTETLIIQLLEEKYDIKLQTQFRIKNRVYDIKYKNILIELDGVFWHSLPENQERDKHKDELAKEQGYKLYRIPITNVRDVPKTMEEYESVFKEIFENNTDEDNNIDNVEQ